MARWTTATIAVLFLIAVPLLADDTAKTGSKPTGKWKKTVGDNSVTFDFKSGDTMVITVLLGGNTIELENDYAVAKDGTIYGRSHKVTKKGTEDGPTEGDLFSFKASIAKDVMTLSDLKSSSGDSGDAKALVEGEYQKEK
jgi:hypothetical protein